MKPKEVDVALVGLGVVGFVLVNEHRYFYGS